MHGTLDQIMVGLVVNLGTRVQQAELPPSTHSSALVTGHQGAANHNSHRWASKGRVDSSSRECLDSNNLIRLSSNLPVSTSLVK